MSKPKLRVETTYLDGLPRADKYCAKCRRPGCQVVRTYYDGNVPMQQRYYHVLCKPKPRGGSY